MKTILHVGAGGATIPPGYWPQGEYREVTIDLDPAVNPDIVADACSIPLPDESGDGIFCSHVLEHLAEAHLVRALSEFRRLLKPGGELVVIVPNLEEAARWIVDGRAVEPMYVVPVGAERRPVRPLDLIYGWGTELAQRPLMSHRTGFTPGILSWWLAQAGFEGDLDRAQFSLYARTRKNGSAPLFETLNPLHDPMILTSQGEPVESHPPDPQPDPQPQETNQPEVEPAPFTSSGGVGDSANVQIVEPDNDAS